jgi:hypothetical protein
MTDAEANNPDALPQLAMCVDVPASGALTPDASEGIPFEPPPPFEVCGQCGAPVHFCNGERCDAAGALDAGELLWLTAMRALFLGTFLCRNVASGYGGVLILAARALVGASVGASVPAPTERLAKLAMAYLQGRDLGALSRLSASLRTTNDTHLWRRRCDAEKAALSMRKPEGKVHP